MDRLALIMEDCVRDLQMMRSRLEAVVNREEKYVDPDHALEPDSRSTLWERYDTVVARIAGEFPDLLKSIPVRNAPGGWEEPLDREDLQSFDRDIEEVQNLLTGKINAQASANVKALADTSMCEQSTNPKAPQLTVRDLQEYRVYRIRLVQFLHIFLLYLDFKQGAEVPQNVMEDGPKEFAATLQVATLGWLASLVDRNSKAMNVFKLWVRLFPSRQPEIEAVRLAIQPHLEKLTEFRNVAAFHANRTFETQCSAYKAVTTPELSQATDRFFQLCISLLHEENSIPALKEERAKWAG